MTKKPSNRSLRETYGNHPTSVIARSQYLPKRSVGRLRRRNPSLNSNNHFRPCSKHCLWSETENELAVYRAASGLRRRCAPRNDGGGNLSYEPLQWPGADERLVEITWVAGLRRRCAPHNDGLGESIARRGVMTRDGWIETSKRSSQWRSEEETSLTNLPNDGGEQ